MTLNLIPTNYTLIQKDDGSIVLKIGSTFGSTPYIMINEPDGTIVIKKKIDTIIVFDNYSIVNFLQTENITVKNIIKAVIYKDEDVYNYKNLDTKTLLSNIYTLIGNNITAIRNSNLEMKIGQYTKDEYSFIETLGISVINSCMNKNIEEIFNQCIKLNYKFSIKIEFNNGRIVIFDKLQ